MEQSDASLPTGETAPGASNGSMWDWLFPPAFMRQIAGLAVLLVAAVVLGGVLFKVPYVALVPGSARDTEPLLEVSGIESYPSDGELLLTTVRVRQRPNLWEYLWLQMDDDAEILPEAVILGDRSPEENREFNLQLMTDSKSVAVSVALEELGYDAIQADGVLIVQVVEDAAAEAVLTPGDTIVAIDGRPVTSSNELVELLGGYDVGDQISLLVESFDGTVAANDPAEGGGTAPADDELARRFPDAREATVELGPKPDDPDAAFLGVSPTDRIEFNDEFDFLVDIDSGSVGGPSAGLAFTLAVLDQLTEGELTGGATVAVTGTIDAAGRVGAVGGVPQKTVAVRDLGADAFLVPSALGPEELERVMERAGDDLEVIPVDDLDDALEALAGLGGEVEAVEEFAAGNLS